MIYLFTALFCEAKPFIRRLNLIKDTSNTHLQVFSKDNYKLVITGTGMMNAAIAVTNILTSEHTDYRDILINIGCCGTSTSSQLQLGDLIICNKIHDSVTERDYYPDMIYSHKFKESEVFTYPVVQMSTQNMNKKCVYDMEAAAIYQAGNFFLGPHQMLFLKIISDNEKKNISQLSADDITILIEKHEDDLIDYIEKVSQIRLEDSRKDQVQFPKELFDRLVNDLHCSDVMGKQLKQYLSYVSLSNCNYQDTINEFYEQHELPCRDRKEGKKRFEQLKKMWI